MDDPWGSPWADEVQLPEPIKSEDKQLPDFENKPTTPARAATLILPEKTNSPWDDGEDDGFGEWATLPTDNGKNLGLDGQADDWEASETAPAVTTKTESEAISMDWNQSPQSQVNEDAKLAPSPIMKADGLARLPSPDPWATSFTIDNETPQTAPKHIENKGREALETKNEESKDQQPAVESILESLGDKLLPDGKDTPTQEATIINGLENEMGRDDPDAAVNSTTSEVASTPGNQDGDPPSSRPSSSPSEHSHHDEMSQESPRTSFDEEPKRPQIPRKVSTKIQGLVEHFDGLAKQGVSDATDSSTSSGQDTVKATDEVAGDDDDFGDFEEGLSEDKEEPQQPSKTQDQTTAKAPANHGEPPVVRSIAKKFEGPIDFDVDPSVLKDIYPGLEPDAPFEKVFIMDVVPYESFATTEERKIWYRISRYGTMRKHNTGDDDYIRINWPQSQIRKETLNIVARWMEEDRISGRVVLGGASKGSSVFGWNDQKAAPVPLATAFAAKESKRKIETPSEKVPEIPREWPQDLVRKQSVSKRSSSHSSRRNSIKPAESLEESKPTVETPVASFGWNTTLQKSHSLPGHRSTGSISKQPPQLVSPSRRPSSARQPSNGNVTIVNQSPTQASASTKAPPITSLAKSSNRLSSLATSKLTDEDDDWGEMVASPVMTASLQTFSEPPTTQSKGAFPFANTPVLANAVATQPTSHRSTPSFDDILKPMPASARNLEPAVSSPVNATSWNGISSPLSMPSTSSASSTVDPWATADFSFFETATAPAPKPASPATREAVGKSVTFSPSPLGPPRHERKSREETEMDKIVQSVVKSLPDLSYMLRR